MNTHKIFMTRCLELASKGLPSAMPNPSVGAVLIFDNKIIGEGYTSPFGGSHGEVNCINSVNEENKKFISDSTLYVSLEPCSHFGKTPPCADLIIRNKIKKVVIGCTDTFSEVAGKGSERLKTAGIEVVTGVLEKECRELNKRFFTFHEKKRPYFLLKWAQTQDGFIAPESEKHNKERWITGDKTSQFVHKMRSNEMAILVGTNTVLADNPSLTTRNYPGENPVRILLDRELKLWNQKENFSIFDESARTLILNGELDFESESNQAIKVDFSKNLPEQISKILYKKGIQSLIVEGGSRTLQTFIDANFWDEMIVLEGDKNFEKGIKAPIHNLRYGNEFMLGKDKVTIFKNKK